MESHDAGFDTIFTIGSFTIGSRRGWCGY